MTPDIPMYASDMIKVEVIISSGFVATELAAVMDVCRIANRLAVRPVFDLRIACSAACAHPVSLGGLAVAAETLKTWDPLPDFLIIAGGAGLSALNAALPVRSQKVIRAGGQLLLLSDATTAILRGDTPCPVVVHWETEAVLAEHARDMPTSTRLFLRIGRLTTCAGMAATFDAMLAIVAECISGSLADDIGRVLLLDRRRPGKTEQPHGQSDSIGLPDGPLRRALQIMESAIDAPISTADMSRIIGISSRQLERIFARSLGMSPQRYYRSLRLSRARLLIESSGLALLDIALACGFEAPSHFSREFKRAYGISPHMLRRLMTDMRSGSSIDLSEATIGPGWPTLLNPASCPQRAPRPPRAQSPQQIGRSSLNETGNKTTTSAP